MTSFLEQFQAKQRARGRDVGPLFAGLAAELAPQAAPAPRFSRTGTEVAGRGTAPEDVDSVLADWA